MCDGRLDPKEKYIGAYVLLDSMRREINDKFIKENYKNDLQRKEKPK